MLARASVVHPNIVPATVERAQRDGLRLAVEQCVAPALTELARPLDGSECARLVAGADAAIAALERCGLSTRDITPDHVHFDPARGTLLSDSGLPFKLFPPPPVEADAHLAYRSPEELDGAERDARSAVYSLGGVLFTALTCKAPFGGAWSQIYVSHSAPTRPRPTAHLGDLPCELDVVVAQAMAVDPAERYADPGELATALAEALAVASRAAERQKKPTKPKTAKPRAKPRKAGAKTTQRRRKSNPPAAQREGDQPEAKRAAAQRNGDQPEARRHAAQRNGDQSKAKRPAAQRNGNQPEAKRPAAQRSGDQPSAKRPAPPRNGDPRRPKAPAPAPVPQNGDRAHTPSPRDRDVTAAAAPPVPAPAPAPAPTPDPPLGSPPAAAIAEPDASLAGASLAGPSRWADIVVTPKERKRRLRIPRSTSVAAPRRRVRQGHASRRRQRRSRSHGRGALGVVVVLGLAAGAVVGELGSDDEPRTSARATSGGVSVQLPPDWRLAEEGAPRPTLPVAARLAATTGSHQGATIAVGLVADADDAEQLVRTRLLGSYERTVTQRGTGLLRYSVPGSGAGGARAAYVLFTTGPSAITVCTARTAAGLRDCGEVASTVRVRGERAVSPLGPGRDSVEVVLNDLVEYRVERRRILADAVLADEQIDAARELQTAYEEAAARVRRRGDTGAPAAALLAGLEASAAGYAALAEAVETGDQLAFDDARAAVVAAEAVVWSPAVRRG